MTRRRLFATAGVGGLLAATGLLLPTPAQADAVPLYRRCAFGAHVENAPYPNVYPHFGLESITGARLRRMSWFVDVGNWPASAAADAAGSGHDLAVALDLRSGDRRYSLDELLAGRVDGQLRSLFGRMAAYPGTVTVRPFWEMNCNASQWSADYPGGMTRSVDQFIAAWRYLVGLQRAVGGGRIKWWFCVNGTDVGPTPMERYWPGADVVDEMGLDTYNDDWSPWRDFPDKVRPMYTRLAALHPTIPISVGEIGCKPYGAPPGESKARWSEKMFLTTEFPRLTKVDFYNARGTTDWRLQTSWDSLAVYQKYLPVALGGAR